jgi:hypothetical protein
MTTRRSILKRLAGAVAVAFTGLVARVEESRGEDMNGRIMVGADVGNRRGEWIIVNGRLRTGPFLTAEPYEGPVHTFRQGDTSLVAHAPLTTEQFDDLYRQGYRRC